MNPLEAKVREILRRYSDCVVGYYEGDFLKPDQATTSILALIDGEVMAERERCAKVVCHHSRDFQIAVQRDCCIGAEAIRSSGEGK